MELTMNYLMKNPEIVEMVKKGLVSLVGVTKEEEQAIVDSFEDKSIRSYNWM